MFGNIFNISERNANQLALFSLLLILSFQISEHLIFYRKIFPATILLIPSVIYSIYFLLIFLKQQYFYVKKLEFFLAIFILIFPLISVFLQQILLTDQFDAFGRSSLDYARFIFSYGASWFLLGLILGTHNGKIGSILPLVCAIFITVAVALNSTNGMLDYQTLRDTTEVKRLSHLWVANNSVIIFYLAYASFSSRWAKILIFCLFVYVVFSSGGRSSLFFGITSILVYELFIRKSLSISQKLTTFLFLSITLLAVINSLWAEANSDFAQHLLLLNGLSQDGSWQERQHALEVGLNFLPNAFLIGNPTHLASELGNLGWYIHNILSGWQFFGFPFFAITIVTLIVAIKKMLSMRTVHSGSDMFEFKSIMLIYVTISMTLTVFVGYGGFWFVLGLWLSTPIKSASPGN